MKKIFAIALAVVMVLSMASAFALNACTTWGTNWSCTTDATLCGKAKVEVVPYVKVNTACGWEYQVSDCASAIRSEKVYFAIKVTVDANPDPDWFADAELKLEDVGLSLAWNKGITIDLPDAVPAADYDDSVENVYYLDWDASQGKDVLVHDKTDDFDIADVMYEAVVENADYCSNEGYSVCATLKSEYNGYSKVNVLGDYTVEFTNYGAAMFNADDEFNGTILINGKDADEWVTIQVANGAIKLVTWNEKEAAFYNKAMSDFGFVNCGTAACITKANIKANFGWKDALKDCFDWSEKGASVVDTDCVVAIPKTGDASVLAWLF